MAADGFKVGLSSSLAAHVAALRILCLGIFSPVWPWLRPVRFAWTETFSRFGSADEVCGQRSRNVGCKYDLTFNDTGRLANYIPRLVSQHPRLYVLKPSRFANLPNPAAPGIIPLVPDNLLCRKIRGVIFNE